MILDTIGNASAYTSLHKGIATALETVKAYTPENYVTGKVVVDGDNLFLVCNAYATRDPKDAKMEAHRTYIDVMYMVEGEEIIYVKPTERLANPQPYNEGDDVLFGDMDTAVTAVRLTAGSFVVLFPQDAHAPACMVKTSQNVKKIIAKVRV